MASDPILTARGSKALNSALNILPKPDSPFAYVLATVGMLAIAPLPVLALLGLILMNWWELSGYIGAMIIICMIAFAVFWIYALAYITVNKQWAIVAGWWLDFFARRKDWFSSYTTDMRVVRDRFGADDAQDDGAGFFLTMAPAQRFPKRPATTIQLHDDRHITLIAGSRAGKGRSVIIPSLTHHRGSVVVYDPSSELWRETAQYRRKAMGQRTLLLDPFNVSGESTDSWNPLAELEITDPFVVDKVGLIADSLQELSGNDPYWPLAARKMLSMMMLYVVSNSIAERKNLATVHKLLTTGDLDVVWTAMQRDRSLDGLISNYGEGNLLREEKEKASVIETARTALRFLDSAPMKTFMKRSTFKMSELKNGNTSIYLVLPAGMGEAYKAWLRLLFNAAFDAMQDQSIPKPDIPTLLILDEFNLMGKMERIQRAAGEAAKFGIKMMFCLQDIGQLKDTYGEHAYEGFVSNSGVLIMFANNDLLTQKYLSERLGKEYHKVVTTSTGGQGGGSYTYQLRDVARADQVEKLASRQSGDAFIFIQGEKPLRVPRANYDEWNMLEIDRAKPQSIAPETKAKARAAKKPSKLRAAQAAALAAFTPSQ